MRRRRITDEELDSLSADPRAGEVWWCEGSATGLNDGGKTRPVIVLGVAPDGVRVLPLTSRKPPGGTPTPVSHRGGLSWMVTTVEARTVARIALVSSLGPWAGFSAWKARTNNGRGV